MMAALPAFAAGGFPHSFVVGFSGGLAGFRDSTALGTGPSPAVVLPSGFTLDGIYYPGAPYDATVVVVDAGATAVIGDLGGVLVFDGAGALRFYNGADATFSQAGGYSFWSFGDDTNDIYGSGDNGETKRFRIW